MKTGRGGRPKVGSGVVGSVNAQLHRKFREPKLRVEVLGAAEKVRREAARIARNQIGADDRVVRGYTVINNSTGFFSVINIARTNSGRSIGKAWELGTGIHHKKNIASAAHGSPIRAKDHGKKVFVWINKANEYPVGKSFNFSGYTSYGEGRQRRNRAGQFRKRRYNPGQFVFSKEIEGFPGTHALEKAARNMSKVHGWRYTPGIR